MYNVVSVILVFVLLFRLFCCRTCSRILTIRPKTQEFSRVRDTLPLQYMCMCVVYYAQMRNRPVDQPDAGWTTGCPFDQPAIQMNNSLRCKVCNQVEQPELLSFWHSHCCSLRQQASTSVTRRLAVLVEILSTLQISSKLHLCPAICKLFAVCSSFSYMPHHMNYAC